MYSHISSLFPPEVFSTFIIKMFICKHWTQLVCVVLCSPSWHLRVCVNSRRQCCGATKWRQGSREQFLWGFTCCSGASGSFRAVVSQTCSPSLITDQIRIPLHVSGILAKCIWLCAVKSSWEFAQHGPGTACDLQMWSPTQQYRQHVQDYSTGFCFII